MSSSAPWPTPINAGVPPKPALSLPWGRDAELIRPENELPESPINVGKLPIIIRKFLAELRKGTPEFTAADRAGALLDDLTLYVKSGGPDALMFSRQWFQAYMVGIDRVEIALLQIGVDGYDEYYTCKDGIAGLTKITPDDVFAATGVRWITEYPVTNKKSFQALKLVGEGRRSDIFRKPSVLEAKNGNAPTRDITEHIIESDGPDEPGPKNPIR